MCTSYLSPDASGLVPFAIRSHCVALRFVHISTFLAWIEFSFILSINTFHFKESCAVLLVPETLRVAGKDGLGPPPSRCICPYRSLFPAASSGAKMVAGAQLQCSWRPDFPSGLCAGGGTLVCYFWCAVGTISSPPRVCSHDRSRKVWIIGNHRKFPHPILNWCRQLPPPQKHHSRLLISKGSEN